MIEMYEVWDGNEFCGYISPAEYAIDLEAGAKFRYVKVRGYWQFIAVQEVCS